MKHLVALVSSAVLSAVTPALAQARDGSSPYLGADLGYGIFKNNVDDAANESGAMAYGLKFGYQFTERFALELAFTDNGDYQTGEPVACPGSCGPGDSTTDVRSSIRSHGLNAVFQWPIDQRFSFRALLGYTQRKVSLADRDLSQKLDGALLGAGLSARITQRIDAGLEWKTAVLDKKAMDSAWARHLQGSSSVASLGMRLRF
jgi:opacity protein-like surface antigen